MIVIAGVTAPGTCCRNRISARRLVNELGDQLWPKPPSSKPPLMFPVSGLYSVAALYELKLVGPSRLPMAIAVGKVVFSCVKKRNSPVRQSWAIAEVCGFWLDPERVKSALPVREYLNRLSWKNPSTLDMLVFP